MSNWHHNPRTATEHQNLKKVLTELLEKGEDLSESIILADVHQGTKRKPSWRKDGCPCITRARGCTGGFWIVNYGRIETPKTYQDHQAGTNNNTFLNK